MLRGNLPPLQSQPPKGPIPAAAAQIPSQRQQGAQHSASEKPAGLKREVPVELAGPDLNFIGTTPASYAANQQARAEKRARAQQEMPEPQPLVPKTTAPRKRAARRKVKPAAEGLNIRQTLTPENYLAKSVKATRSRPIDSYYAKSEDALEASEWISEAVKYLDEQEYVEAITALHLAYERLPEEGFVYKLFDNFELDAALRLDFDPGVYPSSPEESWDILVLRGIRKIKHGEYEASKTDLQEVLNHHPNDPFARLIFDHACLLINRTAQAGALDNESAAEVTNYDSVKLG
jgi:tetratricopeptide (TPR) repeat protein